MRAESENIRLKVLTGYGREDAQGKVIHAEKTYEMIHEIKIRHRVWIKGRN